MDIQTYNPSEVTFPESVTKVLIVNNALPQPADVGYEYTLMGTKQDTCRALADSALFDACRSLGKSIVEADYFDDVLLYHHATRNDSIYYSDVKLLPEQIVSLCEETGAGAVISFDRLLFNMEKDVFAFPEGYLMGNIKVEIGGVVRCYLPGRSNPLATVFINDSIFWNESADNLSILKYVLPDANTTLRTAGQYIGAKVYINFVPHWVNESRWYYSGMGSRWKEAAAYTSGQKWTYAVERWNSIYKNAKDWKGQAKSASNLALCYEMEGKLEVAQEWATKSYDLFKKNVGDDNANTKLLKIYVGALQDRVRSDKKLNMQFGED